MSRIYNLYSKRSTTNNNPINYDPLDTGLKVQLWYIISDFFSGIDYKYPSVQNKLYVEYGKIWTSIHDILCREHKLESINYSKGHNPSTMNHVGAYFKQLANIDKDLDVIELICITISEIELNFTIEITTDYLRLDALADINTRFQEAGSGFRFYNNEIVKVPSEFTYSQAIQPSLLLTNDILFKNAQDEFLSAFEHYKLRKYEEALTDCLKSLESTIKIICKQKAWAYNETDTIKPLIKVILDKGLVPAYSESFLAGIRNVLEGTVPTLRNKLGGHGKGSIDRKVDEASMSFSINMTASIILYLIQRFREVPQ